jgi:hypothetical protein
MISRAVITFYSLKSIVAAQKKTIPLRVPIDSFGVAPARD